MSEETKESKLVDLIIDIKNNNPVTLMGVPFKEANELLAQFQELEYVYYTDEKEKLFCIRTDDILLMITRKA